MQSNHQKEEVYISQAEWDLRLGNASNVGLLNSYLFMASQFNAWECWIWQKKVGIFFSNNVVNSAIDKPAYNATVLKVLINW